MLVNIISGFHILLCVFLVLVILLQQGKGADMGATFGGGGNTLFGASGADTLLIKITTITAVLFMCTSLFLAVSGRPGGKFQSKLFPGNAAPAVNVVTEETKPETAETKPDEAKPADGEAQKNEAAVAGQPAAQAGQPASEAPAAAASPAAGAAPQAQPEQPAASAPQSQPPVKPETPAEKKPAGK